MKLEDSTRRIGKRARIRRTDRWLDPRWRTALLMHLLVSLTVLATPVSGFLASVQSSGTSRSFRSHWPLQLLSVASHESRFSVSLDDLRSLSSAEDLWNLPGLDKENVKDLAINPYRCLSLQSPQAAHDFWQGLLQSAESATNGDNDDDEPLWIDLFWEQIKYEAMETVQTQPETGPQVYQGILAQPTLCHAVAAVLAHQLQDANVMPATLIQRLFLDVLQQHEDVLAAIRLDLEAVSTRSPSVRSAQIALMFHGGFHALVAYRVSHVFWHAGRRGLAYYLQSSVSRNFGADLHPASQLGPSLFMRQNSGVVIGETAVVGHDVSIMEGVTLGGTGKETGDRHPKVGNGVILQGSATVLGNIPIGDGAIITAKAIVTKPVPPLAVMAGVPAKIRNYRGLEDDDFADDDLQTHLLSKYRDAWRILAVPPE